MSDQNHQVRTLNAPTPPPAQSIDTTVTEIVDSIQTMRSEATTSANAATQAIDAAATAAAEQHTSTIARMDAIDTRIGNIETHDNAEDDPSLGYKSTSDFLVDIKNAAYGNVSEGIRRVANAAGSDEQATFSNPEGGFLIPSGLLNNLLTIDPFAIQTDTGAHTQAIPMGSTSVEIPARADKDHSDSVTGGFRMYRTAEANSVLSSLSSYEKITLQVHDLMGLAFASERLLEDSPMSMAAIIQAGFNSEYRSRLNNERIRGTGNGQYLGFLNSPCQIAIAKESGQAAATINGLNLVKMKARAWDYGECVWMATHDAMVQLIQTHISGSNTDYFLYHPGNGTDKPETLLGRPIVYDENMSALGSKGDIALVNWNEYLEGVKGQGTFDSSIHVRFVTNETCYKFLLRNDGAPWWRTAMQPKNGGSTMSPFVTLAART